MTDVITKPGLYETRMGEIVEVTAEDSQSEGKQWVVRGDGSPTYYTSDGRRVSYKGPGSEHDDPHQLMRYVGSPPVIEHIPVSAPATITVKAGCGQSAKNFWLNVTKERKPGEIERTGVADLDGVSLYESANLRFDPYEYVYW